MIGRKNRIYIQFDGHEEQRNGVGEVMRPVRLRVLSDSRFERAHLLASRYEAESRRCAKAGAFLGAAILVAAALEASILCMCSLYKPEVVAYLRRLRKRPSRQLTRWGLHDCLRVATGVGWLPARVGRRGSRWTPFQLVRRLRNLVHPGVAVRQQTRLYVGRRRWETTRQLFVDATDHLYLRIEVDLRRAMRREGLIPR